MSLYSVNQEFGRNFRVAGHPGRTLDRANGVGYRARKSDTPCVRVLITHRFRQPKYGLMRIFVGRSFNYDASPTRRPVWQRDDSRK